MAERIPYEVALSLCRKMRDENREAPTTAQARQCRACEACCGAQAIKPLDRACCQVRRRYARTVACRV
ncbi:MAG: hypothetical protein A4E28_02957 [Methanocella sp. PtaU1.Bin125]|nr:MAG: hypothetical protein A4E28_02957 [Methanocella sp. PtaU1.Bin125]